MKKRHYFLDSSLTQEIQKHTITDTEQIKHLKNILKLVPGEEIVLTNGKGFGAIFAIAEYQKEGIMLEKTQDLLKETLGVDIILACAILKQDHFELVAQKTTELGITSIIPLVTDRTIKSGIKEIRLQKIIKEAAEQSERTTLPALSNVTSFKEYMSKASASQRPIYLLDPSGIPHTQLVIEKDKSRTILIGPEGGWTEQELAQAHEAGVTIVSLGTTILRAETAAIVGTFWIA
jgi:16S rRNA (uracil1498-N3)-methyltransferase